VYARAAHAQAPYAGTVLPAPNVGQLPPPIPGDPARFTYTAQLGAYPWAYPSWAGGYPLATYPGGGVLAAPLADQGVMQVRAWWPDAPVLQLVRITPDGTRTPVRGGYPLTATQATRRNYATNPSVEAGLNGFVPDAGTPTLTQLADPTAPAGSFVLRATNAGAGSNGVTIPTGLTTVPGARPVTVGFGLRLSALPTSVTVTIGWTDTLGGALTANSAVLSANQTSASVAQFSRQVVTVTPPANAVTPTWKVVAAGMPAAGTMDLDALTFEVGVTDGSFFGGGTLGAVWLGTAELSASTLAPVRTVLDGECPLDVPVTYQVSYPGITGGRVVSDPALLPSGARTWLTHPTAPGAPVRCRPTAAPALTRAAVQASFTILGRTHPVVVTTQRQSPTGTLALDVETFTDRDQLIAMLGDGSPLLLRAPADYGLGDGWWLALGDLTEDPDGRPQWHQARALSAPFIVVDAPPVG
jgi:hypothetical protein